MSDRPPGAAVSLGTRGRRLVDRVHEGLLGAIRDGTLAPGERLVLHRIARELGVSLSPVREAIARLAQDGLVRLEPHRGAVVNALTEQEIDDIYDVREALETFAVARAIARASASDVEALERVVARMERERDRLALRDWFELNREFHHLFVAPCRNAIMLETLDALWDRQAAVSMLSAYVDEPSATERIVADHRALLEAFRARDVELARVLVQRHIREGRETLRRQLGSMRQAGGDRDG